MEQIVFLGMWLVPPSIFIMAGVLLVYYKGLYTSSMENSEDERGALYLYGIGIIVPLTCLLYYHFSLNLPVSFAGAFGYVLFELIGSWVVYGLFTLSGVHSWFKIKTKHLRQQYGMNINFESFQSGQYVVRTRKDEDYQYPYRLELKQVHVEQDLTGSYKILKDVEDWGNSEFWTEEMIKDKLQGFFKARNLFTFDGNLAIVQMPETKQPKIIVLD